MVAMLAGGRGGVGFEDFRRLGRGGIVPLAKYKHADQKDKMKSQVLEGVIGSELVEEDP